MPGQVEDHVGARHERVHGMRIAHVGDVDLHQVLDAGDVEAVAAVVGNERIDQQHARSQVYQAVRQIRADEAEPAGDDDAAVAVEVKVGVMVIVI